MTPAVHGDALTAYVAHCATGRSMRDLARGDGCHASTVLRFVRRCEELRENPEWDAALTAVCSEAFGFPRRPGEKVTRRTIVQALDVTPDRLAAAFTAASVFLRQPGAQLVVADMPQAAVIVGGSVAASLSRADATAAVVMGWVEPVGEASKRLRRYRLTDLGVALASPDDPPPPPPDNAAGPVRKRVPPLDTVLRIHQKSPAILSQDHLRSAGRFRDLYLTRGGAGASDWRRVASALPETLLSILTGACAEDRGIEAIERALGLPSRSGKMLLAVALEVFSRAEALR